VRRSRGMLASQRMLRSSAVWLSVSLVVGGASACERSLPGDEPPASEELPPRPPVGKSMAPIGGGFAPRPASSAALSLSRSVQATKLAVPPQQGHTPRLAFGRGVLGQLSDAALLVYDLATFELVATVPIDQPRAVLTLADGALLAVGARGLARFEPANRRSTRLPRPALLLGDLYADAQVRDRIWLFDGSGSSATLGSPKLWSFRLTETGSTLQLPEQTLELTSPRGGVFGATREGVWLYLSSAGGERLSPGGARLPGFRLPQAALPALVLPARRLDQSLWLEAGGGLTRALVGPPPKLLARSKLAGTPYSAAVADEGRTLAVTVVTGPGPRFELELLDSELRRTALIALPSDAPSGNDDWVREVSANQSVVASTTKPLVAVGGPSRLLIFDTAGKRLFSIPSM
jgi:hypothetical protein